MTRSSDSSKLDQYWTEPKERAVVLLFEGQLSKVKIAQQLGVSTSAIDGWLRDPEFQARLAELRNRLVEQLEGVPFVKKEQRVIALSKLATEAREEWEMHRYLVEQRPAPGGMIVNEKLNEAAAGIYLKALTDIAKELGDRQTNVRLTGKVETQQTVVINLVDVPDHIKGKYMSTRVVPDPAELVEGQGRFLDAPQASASDDDDPATHESDEENEDDGYDE